MLGITLKGPPKKEVEMVFFGWIAMIFFIFFVCQFPLYILAYIVLLFLAVGLFGLIVGAFS